MEVSKSLIKLYGPGIPAALRVLRHVRAELTKGKHSDLTGKIARAHPYIGEEADYEFIWSIIPETTDILSLIEELDEKLLSSEAKFTITTLVPEQDKLIYDFNSSEITGAAYTFFRIYGPSLSKAFNLLNSTVLYQNTGVKPSKGILLGKYDFVMEWLRIPTVNDIVDLLEQIDDVLKVTGVNYKVTTRSKLKLHSDPQDKSRKRPIMEIGAPSPSFSVETGVTDDN
jgi:hypothetical protein